MAKRSSSKKVVGEGGIDVVYWPSRSSPAGCRGEYALNALPMRKACTEGDVNRLAGAPQYSAVHLVRIQIQPPGRGETLGARG